MIIEDWFEGDIDKEVKEDKGTVYKTRNRAQYNKMQQNERNGKENKPFVSKFDIYLDEDPRKNNINIKHDNKSIQVDEFENTTNSKLG